MGQMCDMSTNNDGNMSSLDPHIFQGGWDYDLVERLDPRLECSICLLCLRNPHQTSCGHLFCFSCIITWLQQGKSCPHDNCSLGEGDLFPDQKTAQEVDHLDIRCPKGCGSIFKIAQLPQHICDGQQKQQPCPECGDYLEGVTEEMGQHRHRLVCLNASVACPYAGVGCQERPKKKDMNSHLEQGVVHHVQLLHEKLNKLQQVIAMPPSNGRSDNSLQDLYERMISLEQSFCHQEIRQRSALASSTPNHPPTATSPVNGTLVWRISEFSGVKLKRLRQQQPIYSPPFYTAAQLGYKMCLRCSVKNGFLEIFVHFMPGEDDDLLDWPFSGQFHLRLKNRREHETDLVEKISSQPKMEAFKCPSPESLRNKIGFGLQELISIDKVMNGGFWNSSRDEVVVIARIVVAHDKGGDEGNGDGGGGGGGVGDVNGAKTM